MSLLMKIRFVQADGRETEIETTSVVITRLPDTLRVPVMTSEWTQGEWGPRPVFIEKVFRRVKADDDGATYEEVV